MCFHVCFFNRSSCICLLSCFIDVCKSRIYILSSLVPLFRFLLNHRFCSILRISYFVLTGFKLGRQIVWHFLVILDIISLYQTLFHYVRHLFHYVRHYFILSDIISLCQTLFHYIRHYFSKSDIISLFQTLIELYKTLFQFVRHYFNMSDIISVCQTLSLYVKHYFSRYVRHYFSL